ncbi:pimeloyl-ACP methyl ester carboxylesterase [Sediminihabitans luteus]|uniref:Pimeloyl-ACP methyl ester carboxylesterase n=1 Tax=Sediminihabitans luteus TaxID=1138585 RepID=A0A2M9CZ17_9CELL|nr:alpha/beta hydrolase [Sediminihabitans luteus]PJJ77150.1 pimeloyl-ACP methyl ester carboxylesterase [Sediminihabitans luteus]GII98598.1 alpha/beta hydrolase [Sediminihabitans luteus]
MSTFIPPFVPRIVSALRSRRRAAVASAAAFAVGLAMLGVAGPAANAGTTVEAGRGQAPRPTVVLVHGAFADSSGWSLVSTALQGAGYPVLAFSNPLRGIPYDSDYLRDYLSTIDGPVVLVGHSYGGAVISNAATGNPNVKSLVYVAAYALDEGESVAAANTLGGGHTDVTDHLVVRPFPGAAADDGDAYIDPAFFPQLFAQDLPKPVATAMAGSQRPGAIGSLFAASGVPAWKTIPSWYMVASNDRIIPPEAERAMAARAGATTVEVRSSHVPMISQPLAVVALIKAAAR